MNLLILVSPLILLALMLTMERVERPLRYRSVADELEAFLGDARPEEVEAFVSDGFAAAIDGYWARRRPGLRRRSVGRAV